MNTKMKWLLSLFGVLAITGSAVGGYFGLKDSNKYSDFYINPVSDDINGTTGSYKGAVLDGAELVLAPGFTHKTPIEEVVKAHKELFSNVGFLLYDEAVTPDSDAAYNTWNIKYRTDLGSIQVGIAIAYFLNQYQDIYLSGDNKLTWACWGGRAYSSVTSFMGGIQKGIEWANKNLKDKQIEGKKYVQVEQVYANSKVEFTGGFGPSDGIGTMIDIINKEPDALIPVAGPQVWTAQEEIIKKGSKTILIGVDSPVEDDARNRNLSYTTADNKKVGNGKIIQFSSLKKLDESTVRALTIINNGNRIPYTSPEYVGFSQHGIEGELAGLGTVAVGNIINGLVGISNIGKQYLQNALTVSGKPDPSNNLEYSELTNMIYKTVDVASSDKDPVTGEALYHINYGLPPFGLTQQPYINVTDTSKILNKKNTIKYGRQKDSKKIKVILSSAASVLMDASFSQSCYTGLYLYFKLMRIAIPPPVGVGG